MGRWYPKEDYVVPGSFLVRSPSMGCIFSYYKHFYSRKYARLLATHRPDLYCGLRRYPEGSLEWCLIHAWAEAQLVKRRMAA